MVGPFLSDTALAGVRSTFQRDLTDSCEVWRIGERTNNALGSEATRTLHDTLSCKYGPPGRLTQATSEQVNVSGVEVVVQAMVKLAANADVQEEDRLIVTLAETSEVIPLDVVFVRRKSREFSRSVLCKFISPPDDDE